MFEVEHVTLHEGFADFFIRPGDEHLVVVVGALRHAHGEVNRDLDVHPLPVGFQQDAEFLGSTQGKDGNQNLAA